jgi:phosphonatase-like hydrolase
MLPASIEIILFDMAGTTVNDAAMGKSMVVDALIRSFNTIGLSVTETEVMENRGKPKRATISEILHHHTKSGFPSILPKDAADAVYSEFLSRLREGIHALEEMNGASDLFRHLKSRGINIGVGSGFPTEIVEGIVDRLGWREKNLIDYVASAESVGAGRPDPKMIFDIMGKFSVKDPQNVVKVGDTEVDILEGKNAGTWTVGVLSGTQPRKRLAALQPDFLVENIRSIADLILPGPTYA